MSAPSDEFEQLIAVHAQRTGEEEIVHGLADALVEEFSNEIANFSAVIGGRERHLTACAAFVLAQVAQVDDEFAPIIKALRHPRMLRLLRIGVTFGLWLGRRGPVVRELTL